MGVAATLPELSEWTLQLIVNQNRESSLLVMSILCHNLVTYKHNNCTIMNYFLELFVCQELAIQDNWPHCKELLCTTR